MTPEAWIAFATVVIASLVSACGIVILFSLALRIGDSEVLLRRAVAVALYVLCGALVLFGIYLIVPIFH